MRVFAAVTCNGYILHAPTALEQEKEDPMSITITPIATTSNNIAVYRHPESHSHRPDLDAEVISKINLPENSTFFRGTIDLDRIIGKDHLVETNAEDTIVYLQRGNRPGKSRMVLKEADDTSFVTIIACVAREEEGTPAELVGKWILVTLFEGKPGEREPFDRAFENGNNPEGKAAAEAFWANHGLVPTEAERIKILEDFDVDVDDIKENIESDNWKVVVKSEEDIGGLGGYPMDVFFDTKENAIDYAINCISKGTEVYGISEAW
jgi:hypothetical protein